MLENFSTSFTVWNGEVDYCCFTLLLSIHISIHFHIQINKYIYIDEEPYMEKIWGHKLRERE